MVGQSRGARDVEAVATTEQAALSHEEGRDVSADAGSKTWCRASAGFCVVNVILLLLMGASWQGFRTASTALGEDGDLDELLKSRIEQQRIKIVDLQKENEDLQEQALQEVSLAGGLNDNVNELRGEILRLKALSSTFKDHDGAMDAIGKINAENAVLRKIQKELEEAQTAQGQKLQQGQSEKEQMEKQRSDMEKQVLEAQKSNGQGQIDSEDDRFSGVPMVDVIGASAVREAWMGRKTWWRGIITLLDEYSVRDNSNWKKYNAFGPIYDICPQGRLQSYGKADEEKKICHMDRLIDISGGCEIFSVGSNGQWEWERMIFRQLPQCTVHTFDCTGNFPAPSDISSRVFSYQLCIGLPERGANYKPYSELLKVAGFKKPPTYFKMDVEGFEWNVFPDMLVAGVDLPNQIGFEIHWHKLKSALGWQKGSKTTGEIAAFGEMWFRSGYLPLHRRDNGYGVPGEATEYLMVKVSKPT